MKCMMPPKGWECSRVKGHEGPCAARPAIHKNGRENKFRVFDPPTNSFSYFDIHSTWGRIPLDLRENVQQWSGLKDVNGKDIYEGDVIEASVKIFGREQTLLLEVVFENGKFEGFVIEDGEPGIPLILEGALNKCEVITNC